MFGQVLLEFKEYATEVDVEIVRKSVRCIGRAAIALEGAAEKCISVLLELIQTKVNYVVQEAIIVIRDIFRRYPNQYESIIGTLCDNLDTLDECAPSALLPALPRSRSTRTPDAHELPRVTSACRPPLCGASVCVGRPEAKASMIWIVGEYAERIDNAEELLSMFLETFGEEPAAVQLQLVTATVKLFLKKPTAGPQAMLQSARARPGAPPLPPTRGRGDTEGGLKEVVAHVSCCGLVTWASGLDLWAHPFG